MTGEIRIPIPDHADYVITNLTAGPLFGRDSGVEEIFVPLVRQMKPKTLVEIGVWHGFTTACLAWAMPKDSILYGLDVKIRDTAQQILAAYGLTERVRLIEGDSRETYKQLPDGLDFVYIDGGHEPHEVRADYENIWPKMAPNGIVAFHDVSAVCGVREYVPANFPSNTGIYIPFDMGLLLIQKDRKLVLTESGQMVPWAAGPAIHNP